jgi:alpha-glucosidase
MWWQDAVVYQIYPRSFQDADGDGVGDLRGITSRLDHVAWLGVDALWLSPMYPSPLADLGYDVADYRAVDPQLGTLDDFDRLLEAAHARGLRVLLDLVPCHTSIEHPWFRQHPDWYIWSPVDGPPNNWVSAFGGPAWSRDETSGRWYLHSFYPEQPDLDWRNPAVVEAFRGIVRFWLDRGVDGFRHDAIDRLVKDAQLRDEPPAPAEGFGLPVYGEAATLSRLYHVHQSEAIEALRSLRDVAGDALLVGEVFQPTAGCEPYLDVLDLVFGFEVLFSPWDVERLRAAIEPAAALGRVAWVLSNHDFDRLVTRVGDENARAAALLLLTLPGAAFVYQGDELGLANGPAADPPRDPAGRDPMRNPMQWTQGRGAGFTEGTPWLPLGDRPERNVESERVDSGSLLHFYRRLIELRRRLGGGFRMLEPVHGVLAFERGEHVVAINVTGKPQRAPALGELVLTTHEDAVAGGTLAPHTGALAKRGL